ncbi:glycosyltransferase family 4 protein [Empedobacter falsenii]
MKKLHIVSELFYPNKTSTAYIMTELANFLSSYYNVSVITTNIEYDNNVTDTVQDLSYEVIRKKVGNVDKNSFFNRIKSAIGSSFSLGFELFKKVKKGENVLVVTNPFLIILIIAIIRSLKKFDYTLLVHDVFPENIIPAGLKKQDSSSYKLLKLVFDWSYKKADKVIVLGEDMKKLIIEKGVLESKVDIITNWYDDDLVSMDIDRENYLGIKDLENKIVIGFAGNIGRVQGLEEFIECFNKSDNNNLAFVIIGDGAMQSQLKEKFKENSNIYFLGNKPRDEQSKFLNSFDISLVTLANGMLGLGVPSKSYNILQSGKPILYIGDLESEIDLMIKKYDCGWSFNWSDKEEIIELLKGIELADLKDYKIKNQELANSKFNSSIVKNQFLTVLNK